MQHLRIGTAMVLLTLAASACGGAGTATTTTAVATTAGSSTIAPTTTEAVTTTTTLPPTTTTTLPPPEVAWGEPTTIMTLRPTFVVDQGEAIDAAVQFAVSWGETAYLFAGVDVSGRVHDLGGVTQTDHYSDVAVWSTADGVEWTQQPGLPFPGMFDEWAYAAAAFGSGLVVVGASRESGTTPTQVENMWIFPMSDSDGAVWLGEGTPPAWTRGDQVNLGGDREEEMRDVVALGDRLVAVGSSNVVPEFGEAGRPEYAGAVWISSDGRSWDRVADDAGLFSGPGVSTGLAAAAGNGDEIWAFGVDRGSSSDAPAVWSSADGMAWERLEIDGHEVTTNQGLVVADAALSTAGFLVVGNQSGSAGRFPAAWFSPDAVSWERVDLGTTMEGELVGVATTAFGFIAVGYSRQEGATLPLVLVSADGRTWFDGSGGAFGVEAGERLGLTAVGMHQGLVVVAGVVTYADDHRDVLVWSGLVGGSEG